MEETKLYSNIREREKYENLADLYSIIVAIEQLEKAYIRDAINVEEYEPACAKLISQFKAAKQQVKEDIISVEDFMRQYNMNCPNANRLIQDNAPSAVNPRSEKSVAATVHHSITLMDSLRLNMVAVDQIHPLLSDMIESMSRVTSLRGDFDGIQRLREWRSILDGMKASDELNEEQVRQLLFDLDQIYNKFLHSLLEK